MARRKATSPKRQIESYEHKKEERVNNPPVGLVTPETDPDTGQKKKAYAYDPHLDPQLQWAGKAEHTSFEVPTVSLHVHERIEPRTILEAVRKNGGQWSVNSGQLPLFALPQENPPLREAVEFYRHAHGWSNRLVAGDSLLVMNSLLEKEGMAGKVQMAYFDPPYGIKYGSNFQPFVNKRDVKDGKDEDLTAEPEQIRAFRDTWELGIHSYLAYLRDRLLLARELLVDSGSCFVQISDENVHHVRELMDEVFGAKHAIVTLVLKKKGATTPTDPVNDFVLWYAKDKDKVKRTVKRLYDRRLDPVDDPKFNTLISPGGEHRRIKDLDADTIASLKAGGWRWARVNYPLVSQDFQEERSVPYVFQGRSFSCGDNRHWSYDVPDAMDRLAIAGRLFDGGGRSLGGVVYWDDWPYVALSNVWNDLKGEENPEYVVQTSWRAVERCLLMTTDPGDLVFDPTCGSGTTAYVAEQWGRRWITCDTSRVALTLAKQRLMTAVFDYYELAHPQEGVGSGFKYKTIPHVTLKSIANNPDIREGMTQPQIDAAIARHADQETLYDQPFVDRKKTRVSGPFTVEAVPSPAVKSVDEIVDSEQCIVNSKKGDSAIHDSLSTNHFAATAARSGETLRQGEWRDELLRAGIRGKAGQHIRFSRLEPLPGCRWLHADGETRPNDDGADSVRDGGAAYTAQRAVVAFGPEHAPLEQRQVEMAWEEARTLVPKPKLLVFAAFQFDPEAAKDIDEMKTELAGMQFLKVQMNADLLTDDLKKKRASNESFWLIGQPDVVVDSEQWIVDSKGEALAPYDIIAKLSGVDSLAKITGLSRDDLSEFFAIAQRRDLWAAVADDQGGSLDSGKHRRGAGEAEHRRVSSVSGHRAGFPGRIGDAGDFVRELVSLTERHRRDCIERLRRNREIVDRAREIAASLTTPLTTIHYSQVTIHGFDYYNTKTGQIESGEADKIAVWLLDTDYDGRSLYPRQVFFPMAGENEGWAKLARNLKAEVDEERIEAYRGTVSLPFKPGKHRRIAVKIVDDRLIINSPYEEPARHWRYDRETRLFDLADGRRPAGYVVATPGSMAFDDPGIFVPIPLVNRIRPRVKAWRERGYRGVSSITKRLLEHWRDPEEFETRRLFFCQLEAVETLIWLTEAPPAERVGIEIPSDGGAFVRQCCKMATGSGKTIVMAMVIAWQILNKVTYPQDARFSKHVLVIAPGLTVKKRLSVLELSAEANYYEAFRIVPPELMDKLRQGKVLVRNWHTLSWESEEQVKRRRSVDKRGVKSDEAYTRDVLDEMASTRNWLVINDEAHHAWRVNWEAEGKYLRARDLKDSAEEATVWIGGLDRLHRTRSILTCYDFSATPFTPSGKQSSEEALFGWIVSDFGLNDAIESGLVKTPRVVVRDDAVPDAKTYKSRLYHIYKDPEVKDDLNRRARPEEPLPDLVLNAYHLLGYDWREAYRAWTAAGHLIPPVMITVCNRTETAARVSHAFDSKRIHIDELCESERILHIDSKVLDQAEAHEEEVDSDQWVVDREDEEIVAAEPTTSNKPLATTHHPLTTAQKAELLRRTVDTVGKAGEPGEKIRKVISVGMLSEGWDAKTVTHIMGLRAFTSQLLCEQVVGRGLRRRSYEINPQTGLFEPEYVNIFGVPFTFLPHEGGQDGPPPPPAPKTEVKPEPDKAEFEIRWPNVVRIDHVFYPMLMLDWSKVHPLELDAAKMTKVAELAPILDGKPDVTKITQIELERLAKESRTQRIIFQTARDVFDQMKHTWRGSREVLLAQLVRLVEQFIRADRIAIHPPLFYQDDLRRRLIITLNMSHVVQHIWDAVKQENSERLTPVFDRDHPIRSTGEMRTWYTGKPCERTRKSHIDVCVYDSTWEASDAFVLDNDPSVAAWVKNDHLGFEVLYVYRGVVRKYRPDFLARLVGGEMLILETKGQDTEQDQVKRRYLAEWVEAVNSHGEFGRWRWAVTRQPGDIRDVLAAMTPVATRGE